MTIGPFRNLRRQIRGLLGKRPASASVVASPVGLNPEAARVEFEMNARARCKSVYLGDNVCLCRILGGALMYSIPEITALPRT